MCDASAVDQCHHRKHARRDALLRAAKIWFKEQLALVHEVEDAMDALTMSNLVGGTISPPMPLPTGAYPVEHCCSGGSSDTPCPTCILYCLQRPWLITSIGRTRPHTTCSEAWLQRSPGARHDVANLHYCLYKHQGCKRSYCCMSCPHMRRLLQWHVDIAAAVRGPWTATTLRQNVHKAAGLPPPHSRQRNRGRLSMHSGQSARPPTLPGNKLQKMRST